MGLAWIVGYGVIGCVFMGVAQVMGVAEDWDVVGSGYERVVVASMAVDIYRNKNLLRIFKAIAEGPIYAGELKRRLGVASGTVHYHLKRLVEAGLVTAYRGIDGRRRFYVLTQRGMKVLEKIREIEEAEEKTRTRAKAREKAREITWVGYGWRRL